MCYGLNPDISFCGFTGNAVLCSKPVLVIVMLS